MSRPKNPRRVLVTALESVARQLSWTRNGWTAWHLTSRMVTNDGAPRRREPGEYPEGSEQAWSDTWGHLDMMIEELTEARDFCERQWKTFGNNAVYSLCRRSSK